MLLPALRLMTRLENAILLPKMHFALCPWSLGADEWLSTTKQQVEQRANRLVEPAGHQPAS
jgi:hypothetical protein